MDQPWGLAGSELYTRRPSAGGSPLFAQSEQSFWWGGIKASSLELPCAHALIWNNTNLMCVGAQGF